MLNIKNLKVWYDTIQIIYNVNINIAEGTIISVLGPNGAGKTTLLKSIVNLDIKKEGEIIYDSIDITQLPTSKIVELGISLIPEGRHVFPEMTVLDNLIIGSYTKKSRQLLKENLEKCFNLFNVLYERKNQIAGTLSGGEQQMLSIARGLMSNPKFILFDEPSLGLAPKIIDNIYEKILELNKEFKITVVLVEQNIYRALDISKYAYFIENGKIILEGESSKLKNITEIDSLYL